jgi:hypothetical protein
MRDLDFALQQLLVEIQEAFARFVHLLLQFLRVFLFIRRRQAEVLCPFEFRYPALVGTLNELQKLLVACG